MTCHTAICTFDYAKEGLKLQGTYTFAVRINDPGMPPSPPRTFTASTAYAPPKATPVGPYHTQSLSALSTVAVEYDADVQVPLSSITITGPSGYSFSSPPLPRSSCTYVKTGSAVVQRCSVTPATLGAPACTPPLSQPALRTRWRNEHLLVASVAAGSIHTRGSRNRFSRDLFGIRAEHAVPSSDGPVRARWRREQRMGPLRPTARRTAQRLCLQQEFRTSSCSRRCLCGKHKTSSRKSCRSGIHSM